MKICILTVGYLIAIVNAQNRYTDENRPYKFGFNIEGHQHRKEEKAPGDPTTTPPPEPPRNHKQRLLPLARTDEFSTPAVKASTEQTTRHPGIGGGACSGCFLPTTTKSPNLNKTANQRIQEFSKQTNIESRQNKTSSQVQDKKENNRINNIPNSNIYKSLGRPETGGRNSRIEKTIPNNNKSKNDNASGETPMIVQGREKETIRKKTTIDNFIDDNKSLTPPNVNVKSKASILLPLKNDVDTSGNPENEDSNGADEEKTALLYRFNYTVGFHGHHEDGFKNGDKTGDYFVNSRDGDSRQVTYVANEFGYQPNITLIKLKDGDKNYPKDDTEKDYGLKGYEFKWFYRK